jgi:hypothetical protein
MGFNHANMVLKKPKLESKLDSKFASTNLDSPESKLTSFNCFILSYKTTKKICVEL